jgi:hypothetical protein
MHLDTAPCVSFSAQNFNVSEKIEIECGTCVTVDVAGDLVLEQGLDVQGKLVFPASRQALKVTTPFVFVQGEMVIEELSDKHIPQSDQLLEFHFVGTDDVMFVSHWNQTFDKCESGCNLSKKPFAVAGGTLDFQGIHNTCSTWSRLQSVQDEGVPAMTAMAAPAAKPGCSNVLVQESFDSATLGAAWDGLGSGSAIVENDYFSVSNRLSTWQGPRVYLPVDCISPNEPYLLKFRYRYRHNNSGETHFGVPYVKMIQYKVAADSDWISAPAVYARGSMEKAQQDEWHELQVVLQFNDDMADSTKTSDLAIYIAPFSSVDIIDIDDFVLELAPPTAFEGRSCDRLLVNGQADLSTHTYPFYPTGGVLELVSDQGSPTGSAYFRSSLRSSTWSSAFSQDIAPECLAKAAIYEFSAYVRVDSPVEREVSIQLLVGDTYHLIVICPPSSTNQWVLCNSKIRLTEEHEGATSASLYTRVLGDDTSAMDVADVSFDYQGGRTIQLTLEDPSVSECWGPEAEVLVTSHTIQHEDSQLAVIASVDVNGVITLKDAIHKPITIEDDPNTAVEVAILSRNILFTAAEDDSNDPLHGGHFIIMHTSAPVIQRITGIEVQGFGQQGKLGKYVSFR